LRATGRKFHVSLRTVQRWVRRAKGKPLHSVDWASRRPVPRKVRRTSFEIEGKILSVRKHLKEESVLGEYGSVAIRRSLLEQENRYVPSLRTIGRILVRRGALNDRRRHRWPSPPRGWYVPDVGRARAELDMFDLIEDYVLEGARPVNILTGVALHGGLPGAWPFSAVRADDVIGALLSHWRELGLPGYAQFDNAPLFTGVPGYRDVLGRVIRFCLCLQVTPVFAPLREMGFQASIESFNARWEAKVWERYQHSSLKDVCEVSDRYIDAYRRRLGGRVEAAPARRPFPKKFELNLNNPPRGNVFYLRRTNRTGRVQVLGQYFHVTRRWPHRLVRCEVDLQRNRICFFALRRRIPHDHELLRRVIHHVPIGKLKRVTSRW